MVNTSSIFTIYVTKNKYHKIIKTTTTTTAATTTTATTTAAAATAAATNILGVFIIYQMGVKI